MSLNQCIMQRSACDGLCRSQCSSNYKQIAITLYGDGKQRKARHDCNWCRRTDRDTITGFSALAGEPAAGVDTIGPIYRR